MPTTQRRSEAIWKELKKYWHIRVQKDGERRDFYSSRKGLKGKHEAEAKADEWLEKGTGDVSLGDAWDALYARQKATTSRENAEKTEAYGRLYVFKVLSRSKRLANVTPMDWQRVIDRMAENGLSHKTCSNVRACIGTLLSFARRSGWKVNPLERGDVRIPTTAAKSQKTAMQPGELRTLFTEDTITRYGKPCPSFYIHAWRFIVVNGLRRGELCGLRNEDIDNGIMSINRSVNRLGEITPGKTENARRMIMLSDHALSILADQRAMLKRHGIISPWVFPDEEGEMLDSNKLYKAWYTYRKQHGITQALHELRHTFISAVKVKMPEPLLKAMVGHSEDMDTLGVYGHEIDGEMRQTAKIVDAVFGQMIGSKVGCKVGCKGKDKRPKPQ
jgi:integrase